MTEQTFQDIYNEELARDAIINDRMEGHKNDYLILHCLLRKYKPKSFFEIGTNSGWGTMIIKNALGSNSSVFSLDLPDEESYKSKQHPISEGKPGVGYECTLPYIQLRGDSIKFDYTNYPCEGYFVDGEHTFGNVKHETSKILREFPKIIIFHDADIEDVFDGIIVGSFGWKNYELFRTDTRIAYLLRKSL